MGVPFRTNVLQCYDKEGLEVFRGAAKARRHAAHYYNTQQEQ